jgi:hypothetical protein
VSSRVVLRVDAIALLVAAAAAGCHGHTEAAPPPDAYDWGDVAIIGRVCSVIDFRYPYGCPAGQAVSGLEVEAVGSGASVTTIGDGSFGLDAGGSDAVVLRVSDPAGGRLVSLAPVTLVNGRARDVIVPVVSTVVWQQFTAYLGATNDATRDTLILKLDYGGMPASGVFVTPATDTSGPIYYDAGGAFDWSQTNGTTDHGVAIVNGVAASAPASMGLRDVVHGLLITENNVPVEQGALTFMRVDLLSP